MLQEDLTIFKGRINHKFSEDTARGRVVKILSLNAYDPFLLETDSFVKDTLNREFPSKTVTTNQYGVR